MPDPAAEIASQAIEAIHDRLAAAGAFDAVTMAGLPETQGFGASMVRAAVVDPFKWTDLDVRSDEAEVRLSFTITLAVRAGDPVARDNELDRLCNVAKNAINGAALVAGTTLPGWTRLRRGTWVRPAAPERRMTVVGETVWLAAT